MSPSGSKQRWRLAIAGVFLTLLVAAVFTLGSLDIPFEPNWRDVLPLFALSAFVTAAFVVFLLVLMRTLLRLFFERSKQQLGARFKTKMVLGAMVISLLPILFMFFVSYSLLNRTLARWFPRPLELAEQGSNELMRDFGELQAQRLNELAATIVLRSVNTQEEDWNQSKNPANVALESGADAAWIARADGSIGRMAVPPPLNDAPIPPRFARKLPSGMDVWLLAGRPFVAAHTPLTAGATLFVARRLPEDFVARYSAIELQNRAYEQEKQHLRALKGQLLLVLFLFTVLLLFAVLWMALFLAKQVTVPIQALAEGTREVSAGNFEYEVPAQSQDELGVLVRSFNAMTTQLRDSRRQIDEFTRNLQQAVQELERRRQLMETILESIPTGVVSLDNAGDVLRTNPAIGKILGPFARAARTLEEMLGHEAARAVRGLMQRSLRMGVISREIEMVVQGHVLHAAVTVSSLGPRRANTGYVVVLDDLTDLLRAQKSAAWQEVAQRIAHEIKNPLTPIHLSAQRMARFLDRREQETDGGADDPGLTRLVQECSRLISQEVATLASLVDEFSQFVRFPAARLTPTDANDVVRQAIEVFAGRLDGITLEARLEGNLPPVRGDSALLRSVLVNLIDNAAEALENATIKRIHVATCAHPESETVEISVDDTGFGISPEDKDRLFLPNFSTKNRGTGLGLAIVARIVAEHGGKIRVEDNFPVGSRFLIELPVIESVLAHPAGQN